MAEKKEANKSKLGTLKDIIFVYTSVTYKNKQLNEEEKKPISDSADEFHAYEVKILLSGSRFEALKDQYGDNVKNFPHAKRVKPADCVERFGIELPTETMYLIKFSQNVLTGPAIPDPLTPGKTTRKDSRPITLWGVKGKVQDNLGNTIDGTTNIGHGSKGHLQFNPVESKHGIYMYPTLIVITELVAYEGGGGEIDEDALGLAELDEISEEDINTESELLEGEEEMAPEFGD